MNLSKDDIENKQTFRDKIKNFKYSRKGDPLTWKNLHPGSKTTAEC